MQAAIHPSELVQNSAAQYEQQRALGGSVLIANEIKKPNERVQMITFTLSCQRNVK